MDNISCWNLIWHFRHSLEWIQRPLDPCDSALWHQLLLGEEPRDLRLPAGGVHSPPGHRHLPRHKVQTEDRGEFIIFLSPKPDGCRIIHFICFSMFICSLENYLFPHIRYQLHCWNIYLYPRGHHLSTLSRPRHQNMSWRLWRARGTGAWRCRPPSTPPSWSPRTTPSLQTTLMTSSTRWWSSPDPASSFVKPKESISNVSSLARPCVASDQII